MSVPPDAGVSVGASLPVVGDVSVGASLPPDAGVSVGASLPVVGDVSVGVSLPPLLPSPLQLPSIDLEVTLPSLPLL